jgi:hypothetical protein
VNQVSQARLRRLARHPVVAPVPHGNLGGHPRAVDRSVTTRHGERQGFIDGCWRFDG